MNKTKKPLRGGGKLNYKNKILLFFINITLNQYFIRNIDFILFKY